MAASVMTFNDSPKPEGICDGDRPRLCGTGGNIFGGRVPARTWFEAMGPIHQTARVVPLPPTDPRYVNGGPETQVSSTAAESIA